MSICDVKSNFEIKNQGNSQVSIPKDVVRFRRAIVDPAMPLAERVEELYRNRHALLLGKGEGDQLLQELTATTSRLDRLKVRICCPGPNTLLGKIGSIGKHIEVNRSHVEKLMEKIWNTSISDPKRDRGAAKIDALLAKWGTVPYKRLRLEDNRLIHLREEVPEPVIEKLERVRGIREALRSTHFVFSHACSSYFYIQYLFHREFERLLAPGRDMRHIFPFRGPKTLSQGQDAIMEDRRENGGWDIGGMISCDAYHLSTYDSESALSYARVPNTRKPYRESRYTKGFTEEIESWNLPKRLQDSFIERFFQLLSRSVPLGNRFNLWALCVPREKVEESGYFSHVAGFSCQCFDETENEGRWAHELDYPIDPNHPKHREVLEKLQGNIPILCTQAGNEGRAPQYRLFPERLTPENGVFMVPFTDFTDKERQEILKEVRSFARDLYLASQTFAPF